MRESTNLILSLANRLTDGIVTINDEGLIISVNESACSITGYSKGEMVGQNFAGLFPPQDAVASAPVATSPYNHPVEKALQGREEASYQSKPRGRDIDFHILPADLPGQFPAVAVKAVAVINNNNARARDDDPRAARIQMVGLFATGVAHDYNNDLTAINCNVQIAEAHVKRAQALLGENDPAGERLEAALAHLTDTEAIAKRTAALTRQLLAYARQRRTEKEAINLNEAISETLSLVQNLIVERIEIETNLATLLPPVLAERSQIDRILTNLILNARDAMPLGGRLLIQTAWCNLGEEFTRTRPSWAKTGPFVRLSVTDTGQGMSEETVNRIYEEFFTTKAKGTGIGLRTVYQIVKDNDGMIEVESEEGVGTRFDIYLPPTAKRDAKTIRREERARELLLAPQDRSEFHILVAEDKLQLRKLMVEIIGSAGYRVEAVADGGAAVRRFGELAAGDPVSLVILDLGAGGSDARAVKEEIRAIDPQAAVVMTSGYDENAAEDTGPAARDYEFLPKPFDGYKLLAAIESALETRNGAAASAEVTRT